MVNAADEAAAASASAVVRRIPGPEPEQLCKPADTAQSHNANA
jgi:hypothetical protein